MRNLFIIGYMGTGKSTVAKYLSEKHGWDVLEIDEMIVQQEGMSIADIFKTHGEEHFRDIESSLIKDICLQKNKVVSCGGGVVLRSQNVDAMKKSGIIVLLSASPETILERVKDDTNRPLLQGNKTIGSLREMMEKRREKYENAADIIVRTDGKEIVEICNELIEKINLMGE